MAAILGKTYTYLISEFTSISNDVLIDDELYVVDVMKRKVKTGARCEG